MKQIQLQLTVEEINLVLSSLGNLPFIQVHELIGKIQSQASEQLTAGANGNHSMKQNKELEKVITELS
jgi:hypothetical protein